MAKKCLKFKLSPLSDEDKNLLNTLIREYNEIIMKLLIMSKYSRLYIKPNKIRLHDLSYDYLRAKYKLHSNHITSARDRIVEMIRASSYHKVFPNPNEVQ